MAVANINQFQDTIAKGRSVLIILPKRPSFDAVAAGVSLYLSLTNFGKQVSIACPTPMIVDFNRLVGVDKVTDKLSGKNLIVEFAPEASVNIERVRYDGDTESLKLIVVPISGKQPPKEDQVRLNYSGVGADTVILVGVETKGDLGEFAQEEELVSSQMIIIGRNPIHEFMGSVEVIDPQIGSFSQIVAEVLPQANLPIDVDIATNLFGGIERASKGFSALWVDASTFAACAKLMETGASRQFPPGAGRVNIDRNEAVGGQVSAQQQEFRQDADQIKRYKGPMLP